MNPVFIMPDAQWTRVAQKVNQGVTLIVAAEQAYAVMLFEDFTVMQEADETFVYFGQPEAARVEVVMTQELQKALPASDEEQGLIVIDDKLYVVLTLQGYINLFVGKRNSDDGFARILRQFEEMKNR